LHALGKHWPRVTPDAVNTVQPECHPWRIITTRRIQLSLAV